MQNLKIPRGILRFILSHTGPVSRGRCNQIQRDYFGSSPLLHAVISHYSWTTAVNSLLPASSHGWSICTTSATWSRRHELMLVRPLAMWPQFPFLSFSCFLAFLLLLALVLPLSFLSFSLCMWVCVGVLVCVLGMSVCQGNMTGRKLPLTLSLPLIPSRRARTHSSPLLSMQHVLWVEIIWKMVQQSYASTQFVIRWNNLINCGNCWIWMGILSFPTFERAHSSVVCDVMAWPWSFLLFPYFLQWTSFPRRTIND